MLEFERFKIKYTNHSINRVPIKNFNIKNYTKIKITTSIILKQYLLERKNVINKVIIMSCISYMVEINTENKDRRIIIEHDKDGSLRKLTEI